jgi:hypothetical protein
VVGFNFTMFHMLLVVDGVKAAAKWLPRNRPKNEEEVEDLPWAYTSGAPVPAEVIGLVAAVRRRCSAITRSEPKKMQSKDL